MMARMGPGTCAALFMWAPTSGIVLSCALAWGAEQSSVATTTAVNNGMSVIREQESKEYRVLWPGHRILTGTVESVSEDVVKVNTGELMPRVLSMKEAKDKGLPPLKKGEQLQVVVNDQNIVVDYHPAGHSMWHRIIRGQLAQPLPLGQEWAVIRTDEGKEEAFRVRPLARAKVGAIPTNVPAVFLTDEANKIIDATFGGEDAIQRKTGEWKRSPPKAPYRRVEGVVVRSPGWVMVKTPDGKDQMFEVRPFAQEKLSKAGEGAPVVLMVDDENKVSDVARPPS